MFAIRRRLRSYFKNSCFVFHRGLQTLKNNKSNKSFHQFSRVWKPRWNTRTRFWNITYKIDPQPSRQVLRIAKFINRGYYRSILSLCITNLTELNITLSSEFSVAELTHVNNGSSLYWCQTVHNIEEDCSFVGKKKKRNRYYFLVYYLYSFKVVNIDKARISPHVTCELF